MWTKILVKRELGFEYKIENALKGAISKEGQILEKATRMALALYYVMAPGVGFEPTGPEGMAQEGSKGSRRLGAWNEKAALMGPIGLICSGRPWRMKAQASPLRAPSDIPSFDGGSGRRPSAPSSRHWTALSMRTPAGPSMQRGPHPHGRDASRKARCRWSSAARPLRVHERP